MDCRRKRVPGLDSRHDHSKAQHNTTKHVQQSRAREKQRRQQRRSMDDPQLQKNQYRNRNLIRSCDVAHTHNGYWRYCSASPRLCRSRQKQASHTLHPCTPLMSVVRYRDKMIAVTMYLHKRCAQNLISVFHFSPLVVSSVVFFRVSRARQGKALVRQLASQPAIVGTVQNNSIHHPHLLYLYMPRQAIVTYLVHIWMPDFCDEPNGGRRIGVIRREFHQGLVER